MASKYDRGLLLIVPNEGQHYRLGPSSASRWLHCPGSARTDLPQYQTVHTQRGTHLHSVVECYLSEGIPNFEEGEDYEHAQMCIAFAEGVPGEKRFETTFLSDLVEDFGGTIDLCSLTQESIILADWKFGKTKVLVEDNKQLLSYAALARETFGPKNTYECYIVQPKVYKHPQKAVFTDEQVVEHAQKVLEVSGQNYLVAGEHCKWCPLKPTCREYQNRK